MTGVILALVEHPDVALNTLTTARQLAKLMGSARINVLAVRIPPESTIFPSEEVLTDQRAQQIRDREQTRVAVLHRIFDSWAEGARGADVVIDWFDIEGLADTVVSEWGRRADVVVLNRHAQQGRATERLALQAALFETDRPVLVAPPEPVATMGRRVAIAWRDDPRTIKSVLASLRLLSGAEEVHLLAGVREGKPPPGVPAILSEHGIAATLHILPIGSDPFGETLLKAAHGVGADILVMGAYTHSPWRELILGGVTRYMLTHADIPVFMRH